MEIKAHGSWGGMFLIAAEGVGFVGLDACGILFGCGFGSGEVGAGCGFASECVEDPVGIAG